jgi:deoxyadenosine/deoxycytidine kinase
MGVKVISIEGNIGSGKTTLFEKLKKDIRDPNVVFLREPVDIWNHIKNRENENILTKYYDDQEKYAFAFQTLILQTRSQLFQDIMRNSNIKLIICERSIQADKDIFAKMLYNESKMDDILYSTYIYFYNQMKIPLSGVLYINTDAFECKNRVHIRNRTGETMPLSYLKKCETYYEHWIQYHDHISISSDYDKEKVRIFQYIQQVLNVKY